MQVELVVPDGFKPLELQMEDSGDREDIKTSALTRLPSRQRLGA